MTVPFLHLLQTTFRARTTHQAVVCDSYNYTYSALEILARQGAGWLQSLGVEKGDRVVLCTPDKHAFLLAHLATLFAGGVSLPLNPRFTREELRFFLDDSGARVAIVGAEPRLHVEALRRDLPDLRMVVPDSAVTESKICTFCEPELTQDDPCMIIYSSGTTGWPKGIVHTHGNLASALLSLQSCWRFTPDDVVLNVLPLFHIHGLSFATQLTLLSGGCLILDDFEPQQTMKLIGECTVFMAVPTIYYRFLERASFREAARAWQRVRLFTCGSAPIRAEVLPELESVLGKRVINRYGMTEAFVITSLPLDGPWPWGSVGLPLPGIEVRVIAQSAAESDAIKAEECFAPPGEVGTVQLRGPNLFREYWRKPDITRAAFATGWFDTGDLGYRDEAGFLTLVGRKHDLIITSGFNVYPQIVERVINECPGVMESAVIGVPDDRKGERVVAFVVRADPMLDEQRLRAFWSERLVDYQRPKHVAFVNALPRNALGKVLRRELRDAITNKT